MFAGSVILVAFFIPVYFSILLPEINRTLTSAMATTYDEYGTTLPQYNFPLVIISYVIMHFAFGITVGLTTSVLSIKFGSRYRCSKCDISFSRIDSYQKHLELVHGEKPIQLTRILILGGGFAGIEVLRELQKAFQNDISIDITLVSRDNFFLFTPMLPEISSGMIDTRHILTPLRVFCNRAKFYEADVESIDMNNKKVVISHWIGKQTNPIEWRSHILNYLSSLLCEHDKSGRIMTNNFLETLGFTDTVMALGDCACITDPNTGMPYPPTAQHAIRQGKVAATNLISTIMGEENRKKAFDYKTRGVMTLIGKRNGVGILLGYKVHGFTAWWFWRSYYLSNLPTVEKKLRVMVDWFIDLFFKRDVTRLKTPFEEMAIRSNEYMSKMMNSRSRDS